jgi:hypothetical protein
MNPGQPAAPAASKQSKKMCDPEPMFWSGAVAKVPPPVGCVKYKTQPIVLSVQIPVVIEDFENGQEKIKDLPVEV